MAPPAVSGENINQSKTTQICFILTPKQKYMMMNLMCLYRGPCSPLMHFVFEGEHLSSISCFLQKSANWPWFREEIPRKEMPNSQKEKKAVRCVIRPYGRREEDTNQSLCLLLQIKKSLDLSCSRNKRRVLRLFRILIACHICCLCKILFFTAHNM